MPTEAPANDDGPQGPDTPAPRFAGRSEFAQRVRQILDEAASAGWNELILADADFADWPLGERAVADALQAWAKSGRKMVMLAISYDELLRRHARFVTWRRTWSHVAECWRCPKAEPTDFPSALWTPRVALIRLDPDLSTGVHTQEPKRRTELRESLQEWLRKSTPGFPANTLGL